MIYPSIKVAFLSACFIVFGILIGSRVLAASGVSPTMNYQAKLLDVDGNPVPNGTYQIMFRLYDAPSGGTQLWSASSSALSVTVQNGLFTVLLGDTSASGGLQNSLSGVDWNSDSLYLGVKVGSDSEMVPRKRLSSVPQAFNAAALQGMYASSSVASSGGSLFRLHQTQNDAANATRTTLLIESAGTSNTNDFLVRGVNSANAQVFSVNRQGNGWFIGDGYFGGTVTTTYLSIGSLNGILKATNGVVSTFSDNSSNWNNAYTIVNASSSFWDTAYANSVSSWASPLAFSSGTVSIHQANGSTSGYLTASDWNTFNNKQNAIGYTPEDQANKSSNTSLGTSNTLYPTQNAVKSYVDTGLSAKQNTLTIGNIAGTANQVSVSGGTGAIIGSGVTLSLPQDIATGSAPTFSGITVTNATATHASFVNVSSTNVTTTNLIIGNGTTTNLAVTTAAITNLTVAGQSVCLANGTNCQPGGSGDTNWVFNSSEDFVRNATATTDIVIGSTATTSAPFYFKLDGEPASTNRFTIGNLGNANLVVGPTTRLGDMHSGFGLTGRDLYVGGSIGSASSVYSLGEFVAGAGSTHYGNGYINNTGNLVVSSTTVDVQTDGDLFLTSGDAVIVSSTRFSPAVDGGIFGTSIGRWNAFLDQATSTRLVTTYVSSTHATTTNLVAETATITNLTVAGQNVCLADGTNCQPGGGGGGGGDTNWVFNGAGDFVRNATATTDVVIGSTAISSAPFYFNVMSGANSRFIVGGTGNADVVIGATTATNPFHALGVGLDGTAMYAAGDVMSGGRLTTAEGLIVGSAVNDISEFLPGQIVRGGDKILTFTPADSSANATTGGFFVPSSDQGASLGSAAKRWDAYLGNVTATNIIVGSGIQDVFSTTSVRELGTVQILGSVDMDVKGTFAYVATSTGVTIVDTSDVRSLKIVKSLGFSDVHALAVAGDYLAVADGMILRLIDISNPYAPREVSSLDISLYVPYGTGVSPKQLVYNGSGLLVAAIETSGLYTFDITNPFFPKFLSTAGGSPYTFDIHDRYVFGGDGARGVRVYNIQNPDYITVVASDTSFGPPSGQSRKTVLYHDGYIYALDQFTKQIGVFIYDGSSNLLTLVATSTINIGSSSNGSSFQMAASGHSLYVVSSGRSNAELSQLEVFDATSSTMPVSLGYKSISGSSFIGTWRRSHVKVVGSYLYIQDVADDGLHVLDIGGVKTYALDADQAYLGSVHVGGYAAIDRDLRVGGGLNVGQAGLVSYGPVAISAPTSTGDAALVISYTNSSFSSGLCIDDIATAATCEGIPGASILADGAVTANAFDIAEKYAFSGTVEPGDVLIADTSATATVKQSIGVAYDPKLIGIVSTRPGFVLGWDEGAQVALAGRVPTKFSAENGAVEAGDPLTSGHVPGYAMKATKPGMIIGYALESATVTSTIEVFVKPGYDARSILSTDGSISQLTDDLVVAPRAEATAMHSVEDSWGVTFRGSVWNGTSTEARDFILANDVQSVTSSSFVIRNQAQDLLFSINDIGSVRVMKDVTLGGKLYLATRDGAQTSTYVFADQQTSSTYIATNADGWQANDSYDFAERYYSPEKLDPGDVVVISREGTIHVQRAWNETDMLAGIVSTKPAFVAGAPATSTYPIALAGRVPTRVSTIKGAIKAGDLLAPSSMPGVAVKATKAGPVIGQALEDFDQSAIGKIEVFVNPTWWGGEQKPVEVAPTIINNTTVQGPTLPAHAQGYARIDSGSRSVHVSYTSINTYPNVQVTPRGDIQGRWWTDNYTDVGFDIYLEQEQTRNVMFAWQVTATQGGEWLLLSDGTRVGLDPTTGEGVGRIVASPTGTTTLDTLETASSTPEAASESQPPTNELLIESESSENTEITSTVERAPVISITTSTIEVGV